MLHAAGGRVGVFFFFFIMSHVTLHSPSRLIYAFNFTKPCYCLIVSGLRVMLVDLPTSCPPADYNAGLFMK